MKLFVIFLAAITSGNYVLSRFLGICPFLGVSKQVETAAGMGMAVTFVMVLASIASWLVQTFILNVFGLQYLQTIAFILIIASLVQFVEIVLRKISPTLYQALGVYLPLITTNCAILGVAIINITQGYNLIETVVNSVGAALGFTLAIVLFAGLRERMELAEIPESMKGIPIALVTAGLLSIAFLGFTGLV
jgi:electron transport complex protein RnfA